MGFLDRPQTVWWRRVLFQVHLWIGVALGLYLIAISISGSILVFQRELLDDAPRLEDNQADEPSSYEELVEIAAQAHPGEPLNNIDMRSDNRRVIKIGLRSDGGRDRIVFVAAVSRQIVEDEILQDRHPCMTFLEDLHNELLGGRTGASVNGAGGALLFVMSLTGLVLWWPGKKNWKRALKVRWGATWARLNWDIHNAFGFWTLLIVAMWGLTGAYFIFPTPFHNLIAAFSPMSHLQEKVSDWQPGQPILPVGAFLNRAEQMYPNSKLAYLYMDVYRPHGRVQVYLSRDPLVPLTLQEDVVTFEPATGEILSDISSSNWTAGEKLSLAAYSIHFGDFGGKPFKVLWSVVGLIPMLLAVSGYLMWWNRVVRKKIYLLKRMPAHTTGETVEESSAKGAARTVSD